MALERELEFYKRMKPEWLQHYKGQFVLVKDEQLLGTFTKFEEAFEAGIKRLGNEPFLIKQVTEEEEVIQFPALAVGMIHARP